MIVSACNGFTAAPVVTPAFSPQNTLTKTITPAPSRVPSTTPVQLSLRVTDELVNCRYGPGTVYVLVNEFREGQPARVLGRNDASTWWYIRDPGNPQGFCWISSKVTKVDGDPTSLPVVQAPVTSVTGMSLIVEPNRMVVACTQFPQTFFFEAQITANGPALVNWQWEASTGVTSDVRTLFFDEAGTKVINEYYQVGAPNDYWVKLHILRPNELTEQANFRVSCTP